MKAAAIDLIRATDQLRLLSQCERATGRQFVTNTDRHHVEEATNEYIVLGFIYLARAL